MAPEKAQLGVEVDDRHAGYGPGDCALELGEFVAAEHLALTCDNAHVPHVRT